MAVDETILPQQYELVKLSVASGTQLTTRAADVVKNLSRSSPAGKPIVVSVSTRSRNANKLISVVEIAKRESNAAGIRVFQYNALSSEKIQIERKDKQLNGSGPAANGANDGLGDDSDDAFETMGERSADGPKQRVIPVMTTYLSVVTVKELKAKHGYDLQPNDTNDVLAGGRRARELRRFSNLAEVVAGRIHRSTEMQTNRPANM